MQTNTDQAQEQQVAPQDALGSLTSDPQLDMESLAETVERILTAPTTEEAGEAAVEFIVQASGWGWGAAWLKEEFDALHFVGSWGELDDSLRSLAQEADIAMGEGMIGRSGKRGAPVKAKNLTSGSPCALSKAAHIAGAKCGYALPIADVEGTLGVLSFFGLSLSGLTPAILSAHEMLARIVACRWIQLAAPGKNSAVPEAAADSIADWASSMVDDAPFSMMVADASGTLRYINRSAQKLMQQMGSNLSVQVHELVGSSIDVFHQTPGHLGRLVYDPGNLPHKEVVTLGDEQLELSLSPVFDKDRQYQGPMLGWRLVTQEIEQSQQVNEKLSSLLAAGPMLTETAELMQKAADETTERANSVAAASEQVSTNVNTIASSVEEMSTSIKEIARSSTQAADVAGQAVHSAEDTNRSVIELSASSNEINQVVEVITSIAQQTKLLALNATIEAARAGEAGKGFAVVANEVKELAKETADATSEISSKIESIQSNTENAIKAITNITKIISRINELQETIATAVEQQSSTTTEISKNIAEVAEGSQNIAQNITGVAEAAYRTSDGATTTKRSAKELAGLADQLRSLIHEVS